MEKQHCQTQGNTSQARFVSEARAHGQSPQSAPDLSQTIQIVKSPLAVGPFRNQKPKILHNDVEPLGRTNPEGPSSQMQVV